MALFFNETPFPSTPVDWGPTWFLNQLMIFSIIYTFACGKNWSPKVDCPTLLGFLLVGLTIGLLTGIIMLFTPGGDYFAVPGFWQDYLSYPIYFFSGALAQRNGWMEEIKEKSRAVIYSWATLSMVLFVILSLLLPKDLPFVASTLIRAVLMKGILATGMSLAVSVFFMDYVNKKYFCTAFFSKAMYTAYIIQYAFPMLVSLKLFGMILQATGNIAYTEGSDPSIDTAYIVNDNLIFPGWLFVSTVTLIIVWPMAYAIRSIPGFSQVL